MNEQKSNSLELDYKAYLETLSISSLRVLARKIGAVVSGTSKMDFVNAISGVLIGRDRPSPPSGRGAPVKQNYLDPEIIIKLAEIRRLHEERNPIPKMEVASPLPMAKPEAKRTNGFREGLLEIMPAGYGFMRLKNCRPDPAEDVFVPKDVLDDLKLREGDLIRCAVSHNGENFVLEQLLSVNERPVGKYERRTDFARLTACYPNRKFNLDFYDDLGLRLIDALIPIGKGQRALIAAPHKAGKSTLLKQLTKGLLCNHEECDLYLLLINARPEEVTDYRGAFYPKTHIHYTTFDDEIEQHIRTTLLTFSHAMRLAEVGRDAIVLVDSMNTLFQVFSAMHEYDALQSVKGLFGAARCFLEGGSMTVIGTIRTQTGCPSDEMLYRELSQMSNADFLLSEELAAKRVYPAIDLCASGTRREDALIRREQLKTFYYAKERAVALGTAKTLEALGKTKDNTEFWSKCESLLG